MAFLKLSYPALMNLATALETGRICPPFFPSNVVNYVPAPLSGEVAVYGLNSGTAAALVLARRALRFSERLPRADRNALKKPVDS